MKDWIARLHLYAGLLTLVNVLLYAVVGFAALLQAPGTQGEHATWEQPFDTPAGATDRAVADRVVGVLGLSLATPVHDFAIQHDEQHRLVLDFYHANGRHRVTVLQDPGRLHVERTRAGIWKYLSTLHVTTAAFRSGDWRMQLWAWWNEFAMWSLSAMALSGIWIWLRRRGAGGAMRRAHRYTAWIAFALLAIYQISAVQMAHRTWPAIAALNRLHRMRGALPGAMGAALLLLASTGIYLWWRMPRERRTGALVLTTASLFAAGLIICMRLAA